MYQMKKILKKKNIKKKKLIKKKINVMKIKRKFKCYYGIIK